MLVAGLLLALLGVRLALLTDPGRALIVGLVNGARVGPAGRLQVEGLEGDLLSRFTVRRLAVVDARGAWIEARDVALTWRPSELFQRQVHAKSLTVGDLVIIRRPVLEARPKSPPGEAPVSVRLDQVTGRIETRAAFSDVAGDWKLDGALDYARSGRATGRLQAASRLHLGDGVTLDFALGPAARLSLSGKAIEAQGGALAGALGLATNLPFEVSARAEGAAVGGRFSFEARSGGVRPLTAQGSWSPAGGVIDAHVALGASHLTHYFADHIGPDLALAITAHVRPDGLYAIALDARGARAQAQAHGPFDLAHRRTPGLDLALQVADLTLWSHPLQVGPAHARGVFVGDLGTFSYRGTLVGERFVQSGYTLASLGGPAFVTREHGGLTFGGELQGRGGGGEPGALKLLGATPTLKIAGGFDAQRRLEIRAAHLTGAQVVVDAAGTQPWQGPITFAGSATAPNLNFLRSGAQGALDATWRAATRPGDPAWRFEAQVQGRAVATGVREIDRLLGAAPRLAVAGVFLDGAFNFSTLGLTAANLTAQARGVFGRASALGFDVDWDARGPFAAGPLEIAGRIGGHGRIEGVLDAPRVDLAAGIASIDLGELRVRNAQLGLSFAAGDGVSGRLALKGATLQGAASAQADFQLSDAAIELRNVSADAGGVKLAGALGLRDSQPSSADLTLAAGPGAFLGNGQLAARLKIVAHPGGLAGASLVLTGADLGLPGGKPLLHRVSLQATGPLDRLPFKLAVDGGTPAPWRFSGDGRLTRTGSSRDLTLSGAGKLQGAEFHTVSPLQIGLHADARALDAHLAIAGGSAAISARQSLGGGALTLRATAAGVDLAAFTQDYFGKFSASLALEGAGANLAGVLDASLTDARTRDAPSALALGAEVHAMLKGSTLGIAVSAVNAQGLHARAAVNVPVHAAAAPFAFAFDRVGPIVGDFAAQGELRPLWDLLVGGERTLAGRLASQGTISGTLAAPQITGAATLAQGAFKDGQTGLVLQKLNVQADFAHDLVQVRQFTADDTRGGGVAGAGQVGLARDGISTFRLRLTRFQLLDNDLGRASASGAVDVTRDATGRARLTGKLTLDRAEITTKTPTPSGAIAMDVDEVNRPLRAGETSGSRPAAAGLVTLDVGIAARGGVLVHGKGVDAELSLDAHIGGSTAAPDLSGEAHVVRGTFDFSGKRFDFDTGGSIRLASKPENILLDLKAERNDPALDAVVRVRGSAARPEITLTSQPVLPQDEILSRVLFGVSASQLSAYQAAELATALAGLATGGGFDVLANLRQFAGLDRLTLGGDASGPAISGGKYLTKDIYVELTGAAIGRSQAATTAAQIQRTGPSAEVEWRVRRNLSLVSQVWAGGDAQLSVRFRRDY